MSTSDEVLSFWFGAPPTTLPDLGRMVGRHNASLDDEIRARFGDLVRQAGTGRLDHWAATPRGRLALILTLDQFPRHIHRGSARQYDLDAKALELALEGYDRGDDEALAFYECIYLNMPLVHSEDLRIQQRSVVEADRLAARMPAWADYFAGIGPAQTRKYLGVIHRFGHFPHRNALLGRTSTPEELAFLVDWAERQAPDVLRARGLA